MTRLPLIIACTGFEVDGHKGRILLAGRNQRLGKNNTQTAMNSGVKLMKQTEHEISGGMTYTYPLLPLRGLLVLSIHDHSLGCWEAEVHSGPRKRALTQERQLVLAVQKSAEINEPEEGDIHRVGVLAEIKQLLKMPEGQIRVLVEGLQRVRIDEFVETEPCFRVRVQEITEIEEEGPEIEALVRTVQDQFQEYVKLSRKVPSEVIVAVNLHRRTWAVGRHRCRSAGCGGGREEAVLEIPSVRKRLEELVLLLGSEMGDPAAGEKDPRSSPQAAGEESKGILPAGADAGYPAGAGRERCHRQRGRGSFGSG